MHEFMGLNAQAFMDDIINTEWTATSQGKN
jgi:hypothetical protein